VIAVNLSLDLEYDSYPPLIYEWAIFMPTSDFDNLIIENILWTPGS